MTLLQHAPRFEPAEALRLARDLYAIEGTPSPLPSERDQNFALTTPSGQRYVLKIANATERIELLEAQNAAMAHVAPLGICPRVIPARDGRLIARAPSGHLVRLLSWIPGVPLGALKQRPPALLEDVGRTLGRVGAALRQFDHPAIHREFHWDLGRAFDIIRQYAPMIDDAALRGRVLRISGYVQARDDSRLARLRRATVHGDANDYNVLVIEDGPSAPHVSGIIDFGDMTHSYAVAEPAVAIAYAVLDHADPLGAATSIVRAFHASCPLDEDEIAVLWGLVQLRLCVSASLAAWQLRQRPGDEYLSVSQGPIERTLPALASMHPDAVEEAFRNACGFFPAQSSTSVPRAETLVQRRRRLGPNLRLAYSDAVKITRGWMQYLFDESGAQYLDAYNNVPHVGHSHPRVVQAVTDQMRAVNTNTRYLHDAIWQYAERLCATLPDPLSVCFFVNSGSEANELALRLARAHTGARDVIVLDAAYHGNTTTLIEISPYKFNGPGGAGAPEWVHVAPIPDDYRGAFRRADPDAGRKYGEGVGELVDGVRQRERAIAAFIVETCPSVAGQILPPPGYLASAYKHVRAAGGLCVADEVQTAFGRMGTAFYAFESQGVVPDIVVLGKPIGNGYPLGAVITTREIAESFDNGMEYFSTFGGSTVSCAAGLAVLQTVKDEELQAHANRAGARMLTGLRELQARHALVGDVRGSGLFIGVELVLDRETRTPASHAATDVVNRMRQQRILLGTDGPDHNVLKIRPPMPFDERDVDRLVETLDEVLALADR